MAAGSAHRPGVWFEMRGTGERKEIPVTRAECFVLGVIFGVFSGMFMTVFAFSAIVC